ncbi:hypothetical protein VR41_14970, partial [Streptomyces sp. NRRL B-1568]
IADVNWDVYHPVFTSARPTTLFDEIPEVRRLLAQAQAGPATGAGAAAGQDSGGARRHAATGEFPARPRSLPEAEQERLLLELVRGQAATVLGHASAEDFP